MILDLSIELVVTAILAVVGLLIVLLTYLTVRKALENRYKRIVSTYEELLRTKMYRLLQHGEDSRTLLPDGNRYKFQALELLLAHYRDLLSDPGIVNRITAYAELVFTDAYRRRLRSRQWSRRMNTLYRIDHFGMRSFEEQLVRLAEAGKLQTQAELELALCILASFSSSRLIDILNPNASRISGAMRLEVLLRIPEERFYPFIEQFESLPAALQYSVLDVIGIGCRTQWIGFANGRLASADAEQRIRALKALSCMPLLSMRSDYLRHADAEEWQERLMTAKLFAVIRDRSFIPVLERLLSDPVWWVRQQAAQTLLSYHDGRAVLARIAAFAADRFARETAEEYVQKEAIRDGFR